MNMFPPNFVITETLKVGAVYRMIAPELIVTEIPHYFLVIAINNDNNYLLMSTTKYRTKLDHFDKKGIEYDTLAEIQPSSGNGLTEESFFDCNVYHNVTRDSLVEKVKDDLLEYKGQFSSDEYSLILNSISESETFDLPMSLLKL